MRGGAVGSPFDRWSKCRLGMLLSLRWVKNAASVSTRRYLGGKYQKVNTFVEYFLRWFIVLIINIKCSYKAH